ncbi:MAG: hypothetical protein KBE91_03185 [Bacteroidia bacterium]|nr:hypothetical protein [Bacteroidia bacterium]MBP9688587.1 hypothetical protein [Bacteroidia bacterium]
MDPVKIIEKEELANVKFVSYDVLDTKEEKDFRREQVEKAMLIGNGSKGKSKIFFRGDGALLEVETTVWSASDDVITLKSGLMIPLHAITKIDLF